jgi:hypothetical protein
LAEAFDLSAVDEIFEGTQAARLPAAVLVLKRHHRARPTLDKSE